MDFNVFGNQDRTDSWVQSFHSSEERELILTHFNDSENPFETNLLEEFLKIKYTFCAIHYY